MLRRKTDPKTRKHTVCEPAQSKRTWTFEKSHLVRTFTVYRELCPVFGCAGLRGFARAARVCAGLRGFARVRAGLRGFARVCAGLRGLARVRTGLRGFALICVGLRGFALVYAGSRMMRMTQVSNKYDLYLGNYNTGDNVVILKSILFRIESACFW